jgi:Flp pilus assembly protein TadD
MKRKFVSAFLFVFGFMAVSAPAQFVSPSQADTGLGGSNTITGMILTPEGQRLTRPVAIRLQSPTRGDRVIMSDEYGKFTFRGLPSGDYTIVIDKEKEFQPLTQVVSLIQPRGFPPTTQTLSIRLSARPVSDAKPGVINADTAGVPKAALEFYNKAIELAKTGDRKGAIEQLQLAIAEHPNFMLAYNELGVQYLRLNEFEKADEALVGALKIQPEAFAPIMNRGIVLFSMRKYADAEPVLRKARSVKPDASVTHYFLGQALANLGKFDEAEKELATAIATGGDEMKEAHRVLAILYSARGDKNAAAKELESYLKLAPNAPDAEKLRTAIRQLRGENPAKPNN